MNRTGVGMAAALLVGCTNAGPAGTSPASSPVGPTSSASAAATALVATGAPLAVPVTTKRLSAADTKIVVEISVGGGPVVPVALDTGSSGLIVDASAVGPAATATGTPFSTVFTGGSVTGTLVDATVTIGGVSTAAPISVATISPSSLSSTAPPSTATSAAPASSAPPSATMDGVFTNGLMGIMGISAADGTSFEGQQIFAPNLQLPAPYDSGFSLQISNQDGAGGTWTLGPAPTPADPVTLALAPVTTSSAAPSVPAGYPTWGKSPTLCWTIGSRPQTCGTTDLDIGDPTPTLNQNFFSDLEDDGKDYLAFGQSIAIAPPGGSALWSFTSGATMGQDAVVIADLGPVSQFNTGLPFFDGRTVAWNYQTGQVLIGSTAG